MKYNDNDQSVYYRHLYNACPEVIPNMTFLLGCSLYVALVPRFVGSGRANTGGPSRTFEECSKNATFALL